ncbi:MAG: M28 family metallopeptidase [Planctomycetota bacterium]|jgi:hypothetical protein
MIKTIAPNNVSTEFDGRKAFDVLKHLAVTIGPRLTGSEGEHKAARYIAKLFRSYGLTTSFQKFPATTFACDKCKFEVHDGKKWRLIDAQPIGLAKSTPPKGLTGELYLLENSDPDYYSDEMAGKIVLMNGDMDPNHRPKLMSYKPKALVFIETGLGAEPIRKSLRPHEHREFGKLPMARIGHLDGLNIVKKRLKRGRLTMHLSHKKSYCLNVIAEKRGRRFPDEIVVICGHYDSSMGISGASDNAGGTAVVVELARALASQPSKRTLRFIAFAGEETGLQGSLHYADKLKKADEREKKRKTFDTKLDKTELDKHRLVYNLDIQGCILGGHNFCFSGVDDIGASVRLLAKEVGLPSGVKPGAMSSDGSPLAAVGVPALQFARTGGTTGYLHSSLDEIKYLSPEALAQAGVFSELLLKRYVTQGAGLPFPREIPETQQKDLAAYKKPEDKKHRPAAKKAPGKRTQKAKKARKAKKASSRS